MPEAPEQATSGEDVGLPMEQGESETRPSTDVPPPSHPAAAPAAGTGSTGSTGSTGGADPFRQLISQPQFQQMRQVLQQNPQLLAQLMEQLYRTNPELFQIIRNNQERFLAYLNEESAGSEAVGQGEQQQQQPQQQAPVAPGVNPGQGPPADPASAQDPFSGTGGAGNTIRMTTQEREAIERVS